MSTTSQKSQAPKRAERRRTALGTFLAFERKHEPLASGSEFNRRVMRVTGVTFAVLVVWLAVGIWGYRELGHMTLIDALYNASMIMGGMGPVDALPSDAAKLFASLYAILSGVLLLAAVGVMLSPVLHRILHRFHVEDEG